MSQKTFLASIEKMEALIYTQTDKALEQNPGATYAEILEAMEKTTKQGLTLNPKNEAAHIMHMMITIMQHYYARQHPDLAPAEWIERK